MKTKAALLGAAAAIAFAPAAMAERASDGEVRIIYWQAPSILNPFLSGGTKDIESASMIIEPLARYDETGTLVPWLVEEVPTVENGGVSRGPHLDHLEDHARPRLVRRHALHLGRREVHL
jgi:peptide/nickel transport system substrate-binding protein